MASYTLDPLISKIISILVNEASSLRGVREELEEIKRELISMRSFLKDADKNRALTNREEAWVEQVRDIVYDIEDIIHEFTYRMNKDQSGGRFKRILHQTTHFPKNLWVRHQMASKLKKINRMVKGIPERAQRYGTDHLERKTSPFDAKWVKNHGESSLLIDDDDLVGIETVKNGLLGRLTDGQQKRTIISVVGMGGSGKTTLVASTYNSQIVKQHFNCYAWITVSQTYVIEDLLRVMIKEFYEEAKEEIPADLSTMSKRELAGMLKNYLQPKRYFVVLDDVWTMNLWWEISVALPDGMHGSRVILTTRKEDVARSQGYVQQLQPLGKDDSWELFCMKAFRSNPNRCCPAELVVHAKKLVEKCAGLPLAIVSLGGLMSSKESEFEWRKVYDSLNWELSNNPELEVVNSILLLSFHDLPYQLKDCFLYCCIFPEDYLIKRKRLIRLWMAEGFVQEVRGLSPEEVADSHLMELIRRSMLQVAKWNPYGRPKRCKMHDILRELALSKSEKDKFCDIYIRKNSTEERGVRRLSYQAKDKEIESGKVFSKLRSFFLFADHNFSNSSLNKLSLGFQLLWVLDLEGAPISNLSDELVKLFNLKYLNLRRTKVDELPKSIGNLCNLQTLDMKHTKIMELPAGIVKLQNLRYLIISRLNPGHSLDLNFVFAAQAPSDIWKLKNLQVLNGVEIQGDLIRQLKKMNQLRTLGLTKVREGDEQDLCIAIENMKLLHHLILHAINEEEPLRLDALSSAPPHLSKLDLVGKLVKVPRWFNSLQSLTRLHLHWSRSREDILPHIQALPNLARLTLFNAYVGKRLCFLQGFQKLKYLSICNCPQLNGIVIEEGVMPGLEILFLWKCMELKAVPHGIEYLTSLQELGLTESSNELIESIKGDGSVDRPRVRHIPLIKCIYKKKSGWVYKNLA